jgi:hypothetical protein
MASNSSAIRDRLNTSTKTLELSVDDVSRDLQPNWISPLNCYCTLVELRLESELNACMEFLSYFASYSRMDVVLSQRRLKASYSH